jgi:hypothetical protein
MLHQFPAAAVAVTRRNRALVRRTSTVVNCPTPIPVAMVRQAVPSSLADSCQPRA